MNSQTITASLVIIRENLHYIETGDKQSSTLCWLEPTFDPSFEDRLTTALQNVETQQLPKESLKAWLHFLRINGVFANHSHPFVHILNGRLFLKQPSTRSCESFWKMHTRSEFSKTRSMQGFLLRERSRKNAAAVYKEVHKQLFSPLSDEQKSNPSYIGIYVKRHKTYNPLKIYQRLLDDLEEGKAKVSEPIEPNDQEEGEQQALDGDDGDLAEDNKAIRTVTASLQNILHPDFEPSVLQEAFRKEQEIISGYPDSTTKAVDIDFRDLATNFEFDKEAETKLLVAPVQEDLQKFHQSKVYTAEHLSNIMSGCVGRSINKKKESETFKQIRQLLLEAVNGDKQDASFRHSPTIADAARQYKTNMDNLWSRKRFDRNLRVLVIALLRITLAPRRLEKFLRKHQEKVEEKKEEGQAIHKSSGKEKVKSLMKQLDSALLSGQHDWVIQSLVEKLKSAISQPREQTRSNVRTKDAYESHIFDLSEEEDEDNIEEQEDTPIASNQTPKEPSAGTLPQLPISRLVVSKERYQMVTNLFHASAVDEVKT
ncbi:hypothetical protein VTP01DRAFT_1833 [Rhizomucor pusillus]|uniref:uncharacterized protein n=1 Tax=Rhizomucor pusillus TaxID=4840 RepID=UPI0037421450